MWMCKFWPRSGNRVQNGLEVLNAATQKLSNVYLFIRQFDFGLFSWNNYEKFVGTQVDTKISITYIRAFGRENSTCINDILVSWIQPLMCTSLNTKNIGTLHIMLVEFERRIYLATSLLSKFSKKIISPFTKSLLWDSLRGKKGSEKIWDSEK